ncbi:chloride channel protein [Brevibacillus fortis]|uniref:Chloride channel protein n=1 Tax=Brevibacillus fortis TaxID=2126352 RepID=A0A2P7UZ15_9BACL|nr:chloride channel protein [Brevibacillus fortis]MED1780768.1 chloride channel protein [Brevibacillus fortis]PSJ92219.1 chloride channel protein [Brevibacillus fortis]
MKNVGLGSLIVYSIMIGGITGLLTWCFLAIVALTTRILWVDLPSVIDVQNWTLVVCLIGGILVGLCQKYFGNYPRKMDDVVAEFKATKRIDYSSGYQNAITAICVLSFGASLGPEAALVGIVGGLATWAGDVIKAFVKKRTAVNEHGNIMIEYSVEATIGMIFMAPLFGANTFFEERKDPKRIKVIKVLVYSFTTLAGFLVFILLSKIDNRQFSIADFGSATIGTQEIIAIIPLILIGFLLAKLYEFFGYVLHKAFNPLENYKVVKAVLGGLVLGVIGTVLPITLFSGEHQLTELVAEWPHMTAYLLLAIGIVKLFLTEFCLASGWRGGHIFPIIFAGVSIGYGIALLFPIDPVTSITVVTTSLTSAVLQKPIAVLLIFVMIFPVKLIVPMLIAAFLPMYLVKLKWRL